MQARKSCWPLLLAGLLGFVVLGGFMSYVGNSSARNLMENTRSLAQEGLDAAGFTFARSESDEPVLRIVGRAPDQVTAEAACKVAKDKVADRVGAPPSIFTSVECAGLTYPGSGPGSDPRSGQTVDGAPRNPSANTASSVPSSSSDPAVATKGEADTCQARLTEAGKSGSVTFARNRDQILTGQDVLDRVAVAAKQCQKFAIEIGGHTDTGGEAKSNQRLSDERAASVRSYLIKAGVAATQLTARGFGETMPLVNDFPNGNADIPGQPDSPLRAQNRRIEFTVTAQR